MYSNFNLVTNIVFPCQNKRYLCDNMVEADRKFLEHDAMFFLTSEHYNINTVLIQGKPVHGSSPLIGFVLGSALQSRKLAFPLGKGKDSVRCLYDDIVF